MVELPILHGYCTIQLWKNIGRDSFRPMLRIVSNVLVNEFNFYRLNKRVWFISKNPRNGDYYAIRYDGKKGNILHIPMSREILGLPCGVGYAMGMPDHKNHDTREETVENLRVVSQSQNQMNRVKCRSAHRFNGYNKSGNKYFVNVKINGQKIYMPGVFIEVEAALMYNYAANLVYGEYASLNFIHEDEMPSIERQWELYDMVIDRLRLKGFPCEGALC